MQICRSGFYAWIKRRKSLRHKERERLIPKVKEIDQKTRGSYRAQPISAELEAQGESCGRAKAGTLMRLAAVTAKQEKKFKATTDSKHSLAVAPVLLERKFALSEPDRMYCSDITCIWTKEGWLYLSVVIDLFSLLLHSNGF
jgi:transposase InsO family protein